MLPIVASLVRMLNDDDLDNFTGYDEYDDRYERIRAHDRQRHDDAAVRWAQYTWARYADAAGAPTLVTDDDPHYPVYYLDLMCLVHLARYFYEVAAGEYVDELKPFDILGTRPGLSGPEVEALAERYGLRRRDPDDMQGTTYGLVFLRLVDVTSALAQAIGQNHLFAELWVSFLTDPTYPLSEDLLDSALTLGLTPAPRRPAYIWLDALLRSAS